MTDSAGKLKNLQLTGEAGNGLTPAIVKTEGSDRGTDGDSGIPSAAKENVEGLGGDVEDEGGLPRITRLDPIRGDLLQDPSGFGLQPTIWITREELEKMYPGAGKRYLP